MADLRLPHPDEQLRAKFFALRTRRDIADLLEVSDSQLRYHLYVASPRQKYKVFQMPKRSGGTRQITAPVSALKIIQRKLNQVLQAVYRPKPCNHGFSRQKSILTKAREHVRRRFVLNIDLEEFFPSINFGRVRGLFMSPPYNLNARVATVLAQICCFNNELPQGAPPSPIVSNMICAKLDDELRALAWKYKCMYTRYADDITFSTYRVTFPEALGMYNEALGRFEVGQELEDIIKKNGFKINTGKVRLQIQVRRQQVTGLTVYKIVNVRMKYINQIRAMLHAWEKYGQRGVEDEFIRKYDRKGRLPNKRQVSFPYIVKGKIEFLRMVKGKDNPIYTKFYNQSCTLAPQFIKQQSTPIQAINLARPKIITEGKTDWKHLRASLNKLKQQGLFTEMECDFYESEDERGAPKIKRMCEELSRLPQNQMTVFIFDNDQLEITKDVSDDEREYKSWGNNVFSFVIPVPKHRLQTPEVCIEMYYKMEISLEKMKIIGAFS